MGLDYGSSKTKISSYGVKVYGSSMTKKSSYGVMGFWGWVMVHQGHKDLVIGLWGNGFGYWFINDPKI